MDITANRYTFFGLSCYDNSGAEEYTYRVGNNSQLPIALALLMSSGCSNMIPRYFSIMTNDKESDELADTFLKQNIDLKDFINKFNNVLPYDDNIPFSFEDIEPWTPPEFNMDLVNVPNYDLVFDFARYAKKFAQFFAMYSYHYKTCYNGTPLACSIGYINYEQRPEFSSVYTALNNVLNSIVADVVKIFKLRNIEFNEHNMTITVPSFEPLSFKVYYGF